MLLVSKVHTIAELRLEGIGAGVRRAGRSRRMATVAPAQAHNSHGGVPVGGRQQASRATRAPIREKTATCEANPTTRMHMWAIDRHCHVQIIVMIMCENIH